MASRNPKPPPSVKPSAVTLRPGQLPPTLLTPERCSQLLEAGLTPEKEIVNWLAAYLSATPAGELVTALSYQGTVMDMSKQPAITSKYPEAGAWSRAHLVICGKSIVRWLKGPPWGDTISDQLIPRNAECFVEHLWRYRWMVENQAKEAGEAREASECRKPEVHDEGLYN